MRHGKIEVGCQVTDSGTPVYTFKENTDLHGLPEFSQGIIHWRRGAVTRTPDGRLKFNKNKAIRRGRNLFHNQPIEILSNIVETLPTTEDNMRLLQGWKQVCRGWRHHISTYTGPRQSLATQPENGDKGVAAVLIWPRLTHCPEG